MWKFNIWGAREARGRSRCELQNGFACRMLAGRAGDGPPPPASSLKTLRRIGDNAPNSRPSVAYP